MPFQVIRGNLDEMKDNFRKEVFGAIETDEQGILIKADSLGSLEALMILLKQKQISVIKAGKLFLS